VTGYQLQSPLIDAHQTKCTYFNPLKALLYWTSDNIHQGCLWLDCTKRHSQ